MINLKKFKPRKELRMFENQNFVFNNKDEFTLNEKEEKIWSYMAKVNQKEIHVIFQIMFYQNELCISYTSDIYSEEIRTKSSLIAQKVKERMNQIYPKIAVQLEDPIIKQMDKYEKNQSEEYVISNNKENILHIINQNITNKNDTPSTFNLYGKDGEILGNLMKKLSKAVFQPKEDGFHELNLSVENPHSFIKDIESLGYCISYINPEKEEVRITDLLNSGLIEID